jgi:hypothetical protein
MPRTRRSLALGAVVAGAVAVASIPVAAGSLGGTNKQLARPNAATCPAVVATSSVARGQRGIGWTVVRGNTPEPFRVKVLDVLPDGINAGIDMIVVKVADVDGSNIIKNAGGIWAGISGSPVYIGIRLLGSVSYSLTGAPSRIAGVTPAADMVPLLKYPAAAANATSRNQIRLPALTAQRVARVSHRSIAQSSVMNRAPIVLSVSGLDAKARAQLQARLGLTGDGVVVVPGTRGSAGAKTLTRPVAGGNFAGLMSYGDVTSGAIGTTTYVCGSQALAFGHPLLFNGAEALGASGADAIAVVHDPVFGSFKLANIGKPMGTVDQDRLTGLRADLTQFPTLIPVIADVDAPELDRVRTGRTDVAGSEFVPGIAPSHMFADMLTTFDSLGPGTASAYFQVTGRRANGQSFTLNRSNEYLDTSSIVGSAPEELYEDLSILFANGFEPITFTRVHIKTKVFTDITSLSLQKVLVSKNGSAFKAVTSLDVNRGDHLVVRGTLASTNGSTVTRDVRMVIPANANRGAADLFVGGGAAIFRTCFFDPSSCGNNFNQLLNTLQSEPQNNDLAATLSRSDSQGNQVQIVQSATHLNAVANGSTDISVTIH